MWRSYVQEGGIEFCASLAAKSIVIWIAILSSSIFQYRLEIVKLFLLKLNPCQWRDLLFPSSSTVVKALLFYSLCTFLYVGTIRGLLWKKDNFVKVWGFKMGSNSYTRGWGHSDAHAKKVSKESIFKKATIPSNGIKKQGEPGRSLATNVK